MTQTNRSSSAPEVLDSLQGEPVSGLWAGVRRRLELGQPLITVPQYLKAMEDEYRLLTGRDPAPRVRRALQDMIETVNSRHPDTYVARGVQNGVKRAFGKGVLELRWDVGKVQSHGTRSIARFGRQDRVRDLLEEVNVSPGQIDVLNCLQHSLVVLQAAAGPAPALRVVLSPPPPPPKPAAPPPMADPEVAAAVELGEIEADQARERLQQQEERHAALQQTELQKVPQRLPSLVAQGTLSEAEADDLRELNQVDQRLRRGEIDQTEADRVRNTILHGEARDALERKVREVVDQVVRYLQVFESMQKMNPVADDALAFLIRHQEVVVTENPSGPDLMELVEELNGAKELMQQLLEVMDRRDHEIRMMSVRLPPYNYVVKRGVEKIPRMTIGLDFLDLLRHQTVAQFSDLLHSTDPQVRVRPAADMRCLVSLIDHATKRTRFRKELRMLKISQCIEEFYRETTNIEEARRQAENFLQRRLRRLFKDMPGDELNEIRRRGGELIQMIEQKISDERYAAIEAQQEGQPQGKAEEDNQMGLTDEERLRGILVGRVETRVAGSTRRVPYMIMPDPDDETHYLIAHRDQGTGAVMPHLRQGEKRHVVRGVDGYWRNE
ncbi:MAG: hypothetical protein WDA75_24140 [Candidatus Latescibacterota bacterium]